MKEVAYLDPSRAGSWRSLESKLNMKVSDFLQNS